MPIRIIVLMVSSLLFLYLLFTVGAPFLLALVVAIFLEPLTLLFMNKAKMNRLAATTVSSTLFTVVLLGLLGLLGMKLVSELRAFLDKMPSMLENANTYIRSLIEKAQTYSNNGAAPLPDQLEDWVSNITAALSQLSTKLSGVLFSFASGIPDFFIFFIVFLVAVYLFSLSLPTMKSSFLSLFEEKSKLQVEEVLASLRRSVFGFLRAQLLLSVITYILSFTGLLIIGTGYPLAIALVIVIVDILPVLGVGSALVPWAAFQIATGEMYTGIGLILLFLVITVVRRIVEPKILGDAVGIGALSALISLYVGYELVGIVGVFLGPIVVIVFMAMRKAGLFDFKIKFQ
ncbi:sporulation integral membrane protein YtvI [Cohnella sp. CIP 111063]|uniref:sporulation integral membrane protein YtvI n=1 Tax=unclassified Cohnella TaxID=2636738 RepID=UPI000B8C599D|nr:MULTISPECIES: sporulation integral membrane protein YtvI [unclassified Cohnella]OXS55654.1 sporulation integral membrane protein YtvI [Cohnella sp. CIP 111063]PRX66505.1 sporulation integral membrane protein YtvI [Cohnella sp. SGD-V74]